MRYEGYFIDQESNGTWYAVDDRFEVEVVIDHQKTQQDCIDYINEFLI